MRRRSGLIMILASACGARTSLNDGAQHADAQTPVDAGQDAASLDAPSVTDGPSFGPVTAPRAIAPLSTQTVTTQTPTFRWVLPSGVDGARVEICADRECTATETSFDALGASGKPGSALAAGLHFYRLRGIAGSVIGTTAGAAREIIVPRRSAPRDRSWGTFPDFDGDGYADAFATGEVIEQFDPWTVTQAPISIFPGSSSGIHHKNRIEVPAPGVVSSLAVAGDVNGDGFVDLVATNWVWTAQAGSVLLYLGGPGGITTTQTPVTVAPLLSEVEAAGVGDVNGDGYADVFVPSQLFFGGPTGLTPAPSSVSAYWLVVEAGDVNGDGYGDIVASSATGFDVLFGSASGPSNAGSISFQGCTGTLSPTPGDVDGDGIPDIAVCSNTVYYGATGFTTSTALTAPKGEFRNTFAMAGDVNGDGYDDLVIALGTQLSGMIAYGSATGVSSAHTVFFSGPHESGSLVAAAGDLDRDGYMDVLLGETENPYNWLYEFVGSAKGPVESTIVSPMVNGAWAFRTIIR